MVEKSEDSHTISKNFYNSAFALFAYGGYVFGTDKSGKINVKDVGLGKRRVNSGDEILEELS